MSEAQQDAASLPPAEPAAEERKRRLPSALVFALGGMVAVLLALAALSPFWAPPLRGLLPWGGPSSAARQADLAQQLAAAEQSRTAALDRAAALQQQLEAAQQASRQNAAAASAAKDLGERLDRVERRVDSAAAAMREGETAALSPLRTQLQQLDAATREMAARLDRAEQRLAALAADESASGARADRVLLIALDQLRAAVATSRPFAAELEAVQALAKDRPELAAALAPLKDAAAAGYPGTAVLARRFATEAAPAILRANAAPTGPGWGEQALAKLRSLVVIRRTDVAAADDPVEAATATAEAALANGDLAGAVGALDRLSGAPAQAAQPWLDAARPRLQAEQALARAGAELAQRVAADGAGSAGR